MSSSELKDIFKLKIPDDLSGQRLDKALSHHPLIGSRSKAIQLIESGSIKGPKTKLKASSSVRAGEEYEITIPKTVPLELQAIDLKLELVYEDDDLVVVNKPAGLVVHPAAGHAQDTLVNGLIYQVKNFSMGFNEPRPGIVHRLDKDTSGLLVVAKNDYAQDALVRQFKDRSVSRLYRAIVLGRPQRDQARIETYLHRHPVNRKKFASEKNVETRAPKGKIAITNYKLIETYNQELSLLECRLETGRTHQIRVHLSELGHPVVGDPIYGSKTRENRIKSLKIRTQVKEIKGIGLQAIELGFKHPRSGEDLFFKTKWAENLRPLIHELGWSHVE